VERISRTGWIGTALFFVLLAGLLTFGTLLLSRSTDGLDDAYISFRYARNLAGGEGLVYNPGERVEGYSNLLYVLMLAPSFLAGIPDTHTYDYAVALNLVASLLVLGLLLVSLRRSHGPMASGIGGLLFAACPTIWYWNASALETPWVVLLQLFTVAAAGAYVAGGRRSSLAFCAGSAALLVLIRADGFVGGFLVAAYLFLQRRRRAAAIVGGVTAAVLALLIAWRLSYYGSPLPNTYYVKVDGPLIDRIRYAVTRILNSRNLWLTWASLVTVAVAAGGRLVRQRSLSGLDAGLFFSVGLLAYYFYVGGDFFNERMLLVHVPIALLLLFREEILPARATLRSAPALLLIPLAILAYQFAVPDYRASRMDDLLRVGAKERHRSPWSLLGEHLRDHEPGRTLAIDAAGMAPFFSQLPAIDMLGLCDRHIARTPIHGRFWAGHNKYDPEYVLSRKPDLIASLMNEDFVMAAGLGWKWRDHGYRPKYLCSRFDQTPPHLPKVIDIGEKTDEEILRLYLLGYDYLVVKRSAD
jgi:hypothetical protein